jgi:AraC family transcriptional regulator
MMSRNLIADSNSGSTNRFPWSLPFLPVSSSDQERWEGFSVRHYRSPAFEVPEHPLSVHRVQIQLGRPAKLEAIQDGRLLRGRFLNGDLIYTPPRVIYGAQWKEEREILVILLEPSFVARAARGFIAEDRIDTLPQFRFRDPLIEGIGRALCAELESDSSSDRLYAQSLANVLAVHLLKRYSSSGRAIVDTSGQLPKHILRRAIEFINDSLDRNIALAEIGAEVDMSPYHFARLFKRSMGLAPHQYVLELRIERAKTLLSQTSLPLAEISYRVGFASQSHFTAVFRRLTATTPKAYRKAL